jgi:hypothetical protein
MGALLTQVLSLKSQLLNWQACRHKTRRLTSHSPKSRTTLSLPSLAVFVSHSDLDMAPFLEFHFVTMFVN